MSNAKALLLAAVLLGAVIGGFVTVCVGRRPLLQTYRAERTLEAANGRLQAQLATGPASAQIPGLALRGPGRIGTIRTQLALQAASRDVLPTTIGHPLKYRGFDSPLHAGESFFWACYNCNPEMIAQSVHLDPAAQAEAEKVRAGLPAEMQARYPTPESLFGMLQAYDTISHPGPNSEDYFIAFSAPETGDAESAQGPHGMTWRRTTEGWKVAVPASRVELLANRVLGSPDS